MTRRGIASQLRRDRTPARPKEVATSLEVPVIVKSVNEAEVIALSEYPNVDFSDTRGGPPTPEEASLVWGTKGHMADWGSCNEVESHPDIVSGAWVFVGTRVPIRALFENLRDGASLGEFLEWFPGVHSQQAQAVLHHGTPKGVAL